MLCFRPPKKGKKGGATPKAKAPPVAKAMEAAVNKSSGSAASVPENILKKQQRDAKLMEMLAKQRADAKAARADARKAAAANATTFEWHVPKLDVAKGNEFEKHRVCCSCV